MPKTIFARKPVNLNQLKSDVADLKRLFNSQGDAYYVAEELQLSNQEWERLTEDFLADRPCFHQFSEKNLPTTEEGTPCIRVTAPGSEIALIIDTQGYDYARYVGFEANGSSEIEDEDVADEEDNWEEYEDEPAEDLTEEATFASTDFKITNGKVKIPSSGIGGIVTATYTDFFGTAHNVDISIGNIPVLVNSVPADADPSAIYDLQGRRMSLHPGTRLPRGIYIVGGKKVITR